MLPGRSVSNGSSYRYGFNGKENDNEVKGEGNQQDYGLRIYDPRLGRFLSVDPLTKSFPFYSPYQYAGNTPIQAIDLDGGEPKGYKWDNPYVASHPGSGVSRVSSEYDQAPLYGSIGNYTGLINVYAVQDIDKKTFLIYENVHGTRQWAVEYEDGQWKGNVNEFRWESPPNPADVLTAMTVAPIVLVPGILEYGGAGFWQEIYKRVQKQKENNTKAGEEKPEETKAESTTPKKDVDEEGGTTPTEKKPKYSKREAREAGKKKREEQPASEDYVKKYKAKELEKNKGKDARRQAHDKKQKGGGDRSKKQIDDDYNF